MKRFVVSLGVVGVLLLTASSAMAQRGPACMTVACDLQADWAGNTDGLMGIANAMPDAEYGFKPTPAQQSFAAPDARRHDRRQAAEHAGWQDAGAKYQREGLVQGRRPRGHEGVERVRRGGAQGVQRSAAQ